MHLNTQRESRINIVGNECGSTGGKAPAQRHRGRLLPALVAAVLLFVVACGSSAPKGSGAVNPGDSIIFAGLDWDTVAINNAIARFITEHGYGYPTDEIPGSTIPLIQGLARGDIDVMMEISLNNTRGAWETAMATGNIVELGTSLTGLVQGFYVPTYVIKGDPERGLPALAPDLKSVHDLPKYWELFKDPEDPTKGRFHSCIAGWDCEKINAQKFKTYGLDETYHLFLPGTAMALDTSLVAAYTKGEPWLGYYWKPTWILGQYDMTQLEEPPYSDECWSSDVGCAYAVEDYHAAMAAGLAEQDPDLKNFLTNYEVSAELMNELLAYMSENEADFDRVGRYFLAQYTDVWTPWVPSDIAAKVQAAL